MTTMPAVIACEDILHFRPLTLIAQVCRMFPTTELRILRKDTEIPSPADNVSAKELIAMALAVFVDGESVIIEADGPDELIGARCLRALLEKMGAIFSLSQPQLPEGEAKSRVYAVLVEALAPFRGEARVEEFLREAKALFCRTTEMEGKPVPTSHDETTRLGAGLHQSVVDILPSIAEHFVSPLILSFPSADGTKDKHFDLSTLRGARDEYDILAAAPPPGARVVVRTAGAQAKPCALAVAFVLRQLPIVDDWIRRQESLIEDKARLVSSLLDFIRNATVDVAIADRVPLAEKAVLHDLLDSGNVIVSDQSLSKDDALRELVELHAQRIAVPAGAILDSMRWHMHHFPCLSHGVAIPHARVMGGPVISCSLGVYTRGVPWVDDESARLILLFVAPADAPNTYLAYLAQAARLFRDEETLLALMRSRQAYELVANLRMHEIRLGSPLPRHIHTKVLVVESLADDPTLRRDRQLNQGPRMEGVHAQFFYACREKHENSLVFNSKEFLNGLRARIAEADPTYVLFHTGMAFRQFRPDFYGAIVQLRREFTAVRFGYQMSAGVEVDAGVFSTDPETRRFQEAFFPRYY